MKTLSTPAAGALPIGAILLAVLAALLAGPAVARAPLLAVVVPALCAALLLATRLTDAAALRRAAIALCACIIVYPAFLPRRQDGGADLAVLDMRASAQLAIVLAIAAAALWVWLSTPGSLAVFWRGRIGLLAWYFSLVLISLTYTPDPRWAAFAALKLGVALLVLASLAALVQTPKQLQRVTDVMLASIAVVLLIYAADIFSGRATSSTTARLVTSWLHPNHAGLMASVFAVVLAARYFTANPRRTARIAGLLACLGVAAAFVVGSKSGLAAGLFGLALVVVASMRWELAGAVRRLALLAGALGLIVAIFLPASFGIFAHLRAYNESAYVNAADLTGRVPLWNVVLEQAVERPLVGHGYMATFATGFDNGQFWVTRQAHNAFLQTFFDLGLVGVVIVVAIYASAWVSAVRLVVGGAGPDDRWRLGVGLLGGLAVVTANSFTEDIFGGIFESRSMLFLLIVFAIFRCAEMARREDQPAAAEVAR